MKVHLIHVFLKSKKIAIKYCSNNKISLARASRAGFLLIFFCAVAVSACDMSAFVQTDFSERCQLLLDLSDKLALTRRLDHPDSRRINGELTREWIRFFLAHGRHVTAPPTLKFIATDTWEAGINEIGFKLAAFTRDSASADDKVYFRCKISLLKSPEKVQQLHEALNKRKMHLQQGKKIENLDTWFETALIKPASLMIELLDEEQVLFERLNAEVEFQIAAKERIKALIQENYPEIVINSLIENLKNELNQEMQFWESLFYFAT